jgi:predicted DNA binding CopG/RHH family protein
MKNKKKDNDMPIGKVTEIPDFLPPPEELILPEKTVKVTILLNESSINAFKVFAKKHHTQYQKLIRNLIDKYVKEYLAHQS